jgi:DNA-binding SARP family transcriptional activator
MNGGNSGSAAVVGEREHRFRLVLLGQFRLERDGVPLHGSSASSRLLAYLALRTVARRVEVAGALWRDETLVQSSWSELRLGPSVGVDVAELVRCCHCLGVDGLAADVRPLLVDGGELLPGWYDDWVLVERERLRQLRMHGLEDLARLLASRGRFGDAVDAVLTSLRIDPLRESAHRLLLEIHLAEGNPSEALREYDRYVLVARQELRVEPSQRMHDLVAHLLPLMREGKGS